MFDGVESDGPGLLRRELRISPTIEDGCISETSTRGSTLTGTVDLVQTLLT